MPDRALLNQKIQTDFTQGETPAQIRDALNTKDIAVRVPIPTVDIERYLIIKDLWLPIKDSTETVARVTIGALAKFDQLSVNNSETNAKLTQMLDGLIAAGLLSSTNKTEIMAMGDAMQSWADQNWNGDVTLRDVELEVN